jgi:hypothetical protein
LSCLTRFCATYLICAFAICGSGRAQDDPCAVTEVNVNFILPDGRLIRGLQPDNLVAQIKQGNLRISSVSYDDTGPRRVVFILDVGRDLSRDGKKVRPKWFPTLFRELRLTPLLA